MFARDTLPFLSYFRKVSKEFVKLNGFKKEFSWDSMQECILALSRKNFDGKIEFWAPFHLVYYVKEASFSPSDTNT